MELSIIQQSLVGDDFEVTDSEGRVIATCPLIWDRNLFTGEIERRQGRLYAERVRGIDAEIKKLYRQNGARPRARKKGQGATDNPPIEDSRLLKLADDVLLEKETNAKLTDLGKELLADTIACDRYGLLKSWGMTENGQSIEPTFEILMRQPLVFLRDLLAFMRSASLPKKTVTMEKTTADSTGDTSPSEAPIQTVGSPTM